MADNLIPITTLIEPFDINLHLAGSGLASLQQRFMMWLRGVSYPFRFVTWQMPADLSQRIDYVATQAALTPDPQRRRRTASSTNSRSSIARPTTTSTGSPKTRWRGFEPRTDI